MAAYDLEAKADAAAELAPIAQGGSGQVVTITAPGTPGTYDPATDTTTGGSGPVTHIGSGLEEKYSAFSVASGVVAAGDVKFLLSPLKGDGADMPQPVPDSWTLTKADGAWAIKAVEPLSPAGTDVMFTLQLRRS